MSSLSDDSDAYIHVKGTITIPNMAAAGVAANNANNTYKVIFKNCAPLTNYINKINNTQVDDAQGAIISMFVLV